MHKVERRTPNIIIIQYEMSSSPSKIMAHHRGPAGQTDDRLCGTTVQKMSAMAAAASAADNDEEKKRHAWRELGLDDSSDDEASAIYDDHNGYRRLSSGREKRVPRRFVASPSKRGLSVEDIDSKVLADVDDSHDHEDEELDSSPLRKNKSSAVRSLIGHTSSITPGAISNKPRNTQDVLKSQFGKGDKIYAVWREDTTRCSEPSWYPGTIKTYQQESGHYTVTFDDGDELDDLAHNFIMTKDDYLVRMKTEIKPLFEKGDKVYAAYWADDKRTAATPSWYPGTIKRYKEVKGGNDEYGPVRFYDVK